jgi:GMP synthase-like glutamine amidotransferase
LVLRHVPFEDLGLIAPALRDAGISFQYLDLFRNSFAPLPDFSALISMGGPMSANDDLPFIRRELDLIQETAATGKPVLGICLGAQLIAKALGAKVYRNHSREIGWFPVYWTEAAGRDPLFSGLSRPETLFHWHGETFDLPPGAEWLASSAACRNQAFRFGRGVYALQFHLEVTPAMIADWCEEELNAADVRTVEAPIDPDANAARLAELSGLVFGRWTRLITQTP